MKTAKMVVVVIILLMIMTGCTATDLTLAVPTSVPAQESLTVETTFITHIEGEMAEQDVFVESEADPDQVMRIKGVQASDPAVLASMAYAAAEPVEHDFMELGQNPFGPFPKGEPLGFTLEEWLAASGEGTYTLHGDSATLVVNFENLVPNGIYTAWCGRLGFTPSFAMVDMPCGPVDGSQNAFQADDTGNATFELTMHPLLASDDDFFADIAFAYHSDGQTHGMSPGEFGKNSHVQLFVLDPVPAPVAVEPISEDVTFVTHVAFGMPEQDIFIESDTDASQVVRPFDNADGSQEIYAAAEPIEHDPAELGPTPRGPFPKGASLGITLSEWLAAGGEGTYNIEGNQAALDVTLENLVPNGVYTAWCGVITVDEAFVGVDIPCGAVDGSDSRFQADAEGNAVYKVTMPALAVSNDHTFSDIAFAYHSDGQTCGSSPCDFGLNSHVQLFIADYPPAPTDLPQP